MLYKIIMKPTFIILTAIFFLITNRVSAQLPTNLNDCNIYLEKNISRKATRLIKKITESEIDGYQFYYFGDKYLTHLKRKNFKNVEDIFQKHGIFNFEDIVRLMIKNYCCYLNKQEFIIEKEVSRYLEYQNEEWLTLSLDDRKQLKEAEKFKNDTIEYTLNNREVVTINIPQRDLNIHCNEFIKFKSGVIINSLNTIPDNPIPDIEYRYFFLDLNANKIYKLNTSALDFIESIVTFNNELFISGKYKNKNKVVRISKGRIKDIVLTTKTKEHFDKRSWIKLGFYNKKLIALQKNAIFLLDDTTWSYYQNLPFNSYNRHKRNSYDAIIPTENIKVVNDKIYFLQEEVQGSMCDLYEIDLKKNTFSEFFSRNGMNSYYFKNLFDYSFDKNGDTYLCGSRLMDYNFCVKEEKDGLKTIVFNNMMNLKEASDYLVRARIIIEKQNKLILIAENGIYFLERDVVTPVLYFNNQDERFDYYSCKFRPRAYYEIDENNILLGGKWGGINKINLNDYSIEWFDDQEVIETKLIEDL